MNWQEQPLYDGRTIIHWGGRTAPPAPVFQFEQSAAAQLHFPIVIPNVECPREELEQGVQEHQRPSAVRVAAFGVPILSLSR